MIAEHKPDLMTPAQKLQFHLQFMGVMGMAGREEERDKPAYQFPNLRAAIPWPMAAGRWPRSVGRWPRSAARAARRDDPSR